MAQIYPIMHTDPFLPSYASHFCNRMPLPLPPLSKERQSHLYTQPRCQPSNDTRRLFSLPPISSLLDIARDRELDDRSSPPVTADAYPHRDSFEAYQRPRSAMLPPTPPQELLSVSARHSPLQPTSHPFQAAPGLFGLENGISNQQRSPSVEQYPALLRSYQSYSPPPTALSTSPELAPLQGHSHSLQYRLSGLAAQQPLPTDFPRIQIPPSPASSTSPASTTSTMSTASWPSQHHHYIPLSSVRSSVSGASMIIPQDRYICPTCSKAFSRPSSLRIHSHSHTGEKPFRCQSKGCGKAFSVRSNMKRHERGCHVDGKAPSCQPTQAHEAIHGGRELLPASV